MKKTLLRAVCALLAALLLCPCAPAQAVLSAYASLTPASALVASPLTCWLLQKIGSGDYLYSYEIWRDGALYAQGAQRSAHDFFSFIPTLPGVYHVMATVIDVAYENQITVQSGASRVSLRPAPSARTEPVSGSALKISWVPVAGAAGYEVWRGMSKSGAYTLAKYVQAASFINTYLQSGTQYFYKVRSIHLAGGVKYASSAFSAPVCGVPLAKAAIASLKPAGRGRVQLAWNALPGATGYEVSMSASPVGPYIVVRTAAALSLTVTGLPPGAARYFRVRAVKRVGTANFYGAYSGYRGAKVPQ